MPISRYMDKEDVVHTYNGTLTSYKRQRSNAICSNMDGPRDHLIILSEVSQTEKDRYHMMSLTCGI